MRAEKLKLAAAKVSLDIAQSEDFIDAALEALVDGLDSRSLRMLAGLNSTEVSEAEPLFGHVIRELNLSIPSKRDAAMSLARADAKAILDNKISPYEGAMRIWNISLLIENEHLSELDTFIYGASEWEDRPEDRHIFEKGIIEAARDLLRSESPDQDRS